MLWVRLRRWRFSNHLLRLAIQIALRIQLYCNDAHCIDRYSIVEVYQATQFILSKKVHSVMFRDINSESRDILCRQI
jgi:hypothetical protein